MKVTRVFRLVGENLGLWGRKAKDFCDKAARVVEEENLGTAAQGVAKAAFDGAKGRLEKPGAEVSKLNAETEKIFVDKEKAKRDDERADNEERRKQEAHEQAMRHRENKERREDEAHQVAVGSQRVELLDKKLALFDKLARHGLADFQLHLDIDETGEMLILLQKEKPSERVIETRIAEPKEQRPVDDPIKPPPPKKGLGKGLPPDMFKKS